MTKRYEFNGGEIVVTFWRSFEDYGVMWNEWTVEVKGEGAFGMTTPADQDQEKEISFYLIEHGYEI